MEGMQALTEAIGQQTKVLASLVQERKQMPAENGWLHTKAPATVWTATRLHGLGGIFSGAGLERDIITAMVRPRGILSVLPRIPSVIEDPRFGALTGYTATTGDEPDSACDDAPAGYVKACELTAQFGLIRRDTQTIEMDQVMLRANRGDHTDLILRGRVLGLQNVQPSGLNEQQILNIHTMSEMVGAAVQVERVLNTGAWTSTAAGNYGFPGLDFQIATGQVDATTNTACPALDSDIKDFGLNDVCGNTLDIVEYLSMLEHYLRWNAESMGLDPVQHVIVLRMPLWYELSACWPCRYMSNRCTDFSAGGNLNVINDESNVRMRDDMRNRMVIPINGTEYPVIVDTGIFEHNNANNASLAAGQFASTIYMVPLTITGNFPVTYMEYIDYRGAQIDTNLLRGTQEYFWTDNGMFSWAWEFIKWCYKGALKIEPRVVLRTPQLAGKIENVRYSPLQHLREPDPASPYHSDGGVSLRSPATRYSVWL